MILVIAAKSEHISISGKGRIAGQKSMQVINGVNKRKMMKL
jgi:hypothetical protein